jgi:hypothetical protein
MGIMPGIFLFILPVMVSMETISVRLLHCNDFKNKYSYRSMPCFGLLFATGTSPAGGLLRPAD